MTLKCAKEAAHCFGWPAGAGWLCLGGWPGSARKGKAARKGEGRLMPWLAGQVPKRDFLLMARNLAWPCTKEKAANG